MAILGSSLVGVIATFWYSHRLYPVPYHYWRMAKIVLAAVLAFAISTLYLSDNIPVSLLFKMACFATFALLVLGGRVLYGTEWRAILALIRAKSSTDA